MKRGHIPLISSARRWQLVVAVWLSWLSAGPAWGQAAQPLPPVLARLVRPTPGTRSLGAVLAELSRQGKLPFSYSSSLIPVNRQCCLRPGPARPIATVLREVLATAHLSYGLLEGQLVLWPDRLAAPAGVVAVNGRATLAAANRLPTPSGAAAGTNKTTVVTKLPLAQSGYLAGQPALLPSAIDLIHKPIKRVGNAKAGIKAPVNSSPASATLPGYVTRSQLRSGSQRKHKTQYSAPISAAKSQALRPLGKTGKTVAAALPSRSQPHAHFGRLRQQLTQKTVAKSYQKPTYSVLQQPRHSLQRRGPITSLEPLVVAPQSALTAGGKLVPVSTLTDSIHAPGRSVLPAAKPAADSVTKKSNTLAGLLRRSYLHGEAWGSESLPLNAAVKFGLPRIYLVLGVAAGPFDHQSGGAWGVGVGTVGQPLGRFTPSLDLLHWFVGGRQDDGPRGQQLTQLRPALAWQIKRGSRWQLIGGPTLNLAAAHRDGQRTRWDLGQGQWLWLASEDGPNLLRLWPGFQLGVRF